MRSMLVAFALAGAAVASASGIQGATVHTGGLSSAGISTRFRSLLDERDHVKGDTELPMPPKDGELAMHEKPDGEKPPVPKDGDSDVPFKDGEKPDGEKPPVPKDGEPGDDELPEKIPPFVIGMYGGMHGGYGGYGGGPYGDGKDIELPELPEDVKEEVKGGSMGRRGGEEGPWVTGDEKKPDDDFVKGDDKKGGDDAKLPVKDGEFPKDGETAELPMPPKVDGEKPEEKPPVPKDGEEPEGELPKKEDPPFDE